MNPRPLIDTHRHVWDTASAHLTYSWLRHLPRLQGRFTPKEFREPCEPCHRVVGHVFVEAGCDQDASAELAWVRDLPWNAAGSGNGALLGCVAKLDGARPDIHEHLAELRGPSEGSGPGAKRGSVVGVRDILQGGPPERFNDPSFDRGLRAVADAGLTFDLCISHDQLPLAIALLERHPDLTVVLDHMAKPPVLADAAGGVDPAQSAWARNLAALASRPKTFVKLSGLAPEAGDLSGKDGWIEVARRYIDVAYAAFGPRRSMYGSDWPVSYQALGPDEFEDEWPHIVLTEALRGESTDCLDAVAHGTALRCYGLDSPLK